MKAIDSPSRLGPLIIFIANVGTKALPRLCIVYGSVKSSPYWITSSHRFLAYMETIGV